MRGENALPLSVPLTATLFGCWALFVVLHFEILKWFDPVALSKALLPTLPSSMFSLTLARELAFRLLSGHGAVVIFIAAMAGMGLVVSRFLPLAYGSERATSIAMALGFGWAIGSLGWLGLGLVGLWNWQLAWATAVFGIWLAWQYRVAFHLTKLQVVSAPAGTLDRWAFRFLVMEVVLVILVVAAASAGPVTVYDPLHYHLAVPSRFMVEHKIVGLPHHALACFPLGASMMDGWQWLLAGEPVVRAWRVWLVAGILWLIWHLCARERWSAAGLVAAAIFATMPLVIWLGPLNMVDIEECALVLLACLAVRLAWKTSQSLSWVIAAAILTGAACAVKYTTIYWAPWLLWYCTRWHRRWSIGRAGVFICVVLLTFAPWAVRNAVITGNPVYPFAERLFPAAQHLPAAARELMGSEMALRVSPDLWRIHCPSVASGYKNNI